MNRTVRSLYEVFTVELFSSILLILGVLFLHFLAPPPVFPSTVMVEPSVSC